MTKIIDSNEYYNVLDITHYCCEAAQFRYICKECDEPMDCYYCGFDYSKPHDCDML